MSTRFPTPLAIDPWWDLYMPATFGEVRPVEDAIPRVVPDPAVLAVVVRTWRVLGRPARADAVWRRIRTELDPEVAALGVMIEDAPDRWVARVEASGASPGRVVDVWCDRAARALVDGDLPAARAAIRRATDSPLDHAEAGHWARFLASSPDPVLAYQQGVAGRRAAAGHQADVAPLTCRAANGWVSAERLSRRLLGAPSLRAPPGSALARLAEAGNVVGSFAHPSDHARLPPSDPRVELEVLADLVQSLVREDRDAVVLAEQLHRRAWALGAGPGRAATLVLVREARVAPALRPIALTGARALAATTLDGLLWRAWVARLSVGTDRDEAVATATAIAADLRAGDEAWSLALETLEAAGAAPLQPPSAARSSR